MAVNETKAMSQALVQVADKLGYSVSKLYEVYTQGQAAEGLVTLGSIAFVLLVGAVVFGVAYRVLSRREGKKTKEYDILEDEYWDKGETLFWSSIAAFFTLLVAAMVAEVAQEAVLKVLAPEYMAAKELVQAAGGVVG